MNYEQVEEFSQVFKGRHLRNGPWKTSSELIISKVPANQKLLMYIIINSEMEKQTREQERKTYNLWAFGGS